MKVYQAIAETARDITKYCFDERKSHAAAASLEVLRQIVAYFMQDYIDDSDAELVLNAYPQTIVDEYITLHFSIRGQNGAVRFAPSFTNKDGFVLEVWLVDEDGTWFEPAESEDADWYWTVWFDILGRDTKDACDAKE